MQAGAFDELYYFARRYRNGVVDLGKIIRTAYDKNNNNFQTLSRFIDKVDLPELELETVLYDEIMRCGHIDTAEHVLFGYWLRPKLDKNKLKTEALENTLKV